MHNFKDLNVWKKAIDLTVDTYKVVSDFPSDERFGLTQQIKRCVVSISSNIAEGAGRNNDTEFIHFLGIATGSSFELQTQIIISLRLDLLNSEKAEKLLLNIEEVQKMMHGLISKLRKDILKKKS